MRRLVATFFGSVAEFREWLQWRTDVHAEVQGQLGRSVPEQVTTRRRSFEETYGRPR